MQISLETENNNTFRAIFGRQRLAVPSIAVEDFTEICMDAAKKYNDPMEQARYVGDIFRGREVVIVGFMTKFNAQPEINYIDVGAYAMFESTVSGKQETLDTPAKKPSPKKSEPAVDDDAKNEETEDVEKQETKERLLRKREERQEQTLSKSAQGEIRQYCDVLDINVSDITPEKVIENLAPGKSKSFVISVLDEMKSE